MVDYNRQFAELLNQLRNDIRQLGVRETARRADVSKSTVSDFVNQNRLLTGETLQKIAQCLSDWNNQNLAIAHGLKGYMQNLKEQHNAHS
jgi:DNA-binding LacI/PurR family transcriptional regulator